MSLEECKRIADEGMAETRGARRRSLGMVDGEEVGVYLGRTLVGWPWVVDVWAYGEMSSRYFSRKGSATVYFEELTQRYGLKEYPLDKEGEKVDV